MQETREVLKETRELKDTIKALGVDNESWRNILQHQTELQNKLVKNVDVPYIGFNKMYGVEISEYESKYVFYENTFDFDRTKDRNDFLEDEIVYTFRFLVKNIGYTNIEKISIENFSMMYATETWDDNPEIGFYVLPIAEHNQKIDKCINIMPQGEEFIQILITKREEELSDEERVDDFLEYYDFDRLYISFDMRLIGKEEQGYRYILFLSKRSGQTCKSIKGIYTMDCSAFTDISPKNL